MGLKVRPYCSELLEKRAENITMVLCATEADCSLRHEPVSELVLQRPSHAPRVKAR